MLRPGSRGDAAPADGTAEPFGLTVFSCLARTVAGGSRPAGDHQPIAPGERAGELAVRLGARRTIHRAPVAPGDYLALARLAAERHRAGTRTLVALNTVAAARQVHRRLGDEDVPSTLLHPRLRGVERAARLADVTGIVVTAEVAEGLDLSAAVLVTEAAPWPAVVRRAGRCNRDGSVEDAELWWLPPASDDGDSGAAGAGLDSLEGTSVTTEELAARAVPSAPSPVAVLGRDVFTELFDTVSAVDAAPYLLDRDDFDVELAWATWTPGPDGAPDAEVRYPPAEYRCRVPAGDAVRFAARHPVWRFDRSGVRWTRLGDGQGAPPRPLELLLVNATAGGYDPAAGFDPAAPGPVPGSPELLTPGELAERAAAQTPVPAEASRPWQSLAEHSDRVRDQAAALLTVLAPRIPAAAARAAIAAAHLHDAGKAHPDVRPGSRLEARPRVRCGVRPGSRADVRPGPRRADANPRDLRPARGHPGDRPRQVPVRRRGNLAADRARHPGKVRPIHARLPGNDRPRRRLARLRRPGPPSEPGLTARGPFRCPPVARAPQATPAARRWSGALTPRNNAGRHVRQTGPSRHETPRGSEAAALRRPVRR